jgi:hypothetical protein
VLTSFKFTGRYGKLGLRLCQRGEHLIDIRFDASREIAKREFR